MEKSFKERYVEAKKREKPIEKYLNMTFDQYIHARAIKRLIPFPKRFLELGAAVGTSCILFQGLGCESHGIDLVEDLVRAARDRANRLGVSPHFLVASADCLPYKAETFDFCTADSLLEHVEDYQSVLNEAARVLKSNGMLAIITTNALHPFQKEVKITSRIFFPFYSWLPHRLKLKFIRYCLQKRPDLVNYSEHPAVNWFTHRGLTALLEKGGFRVVEYLDTIDASSKRGIKKWLIPFFQRNPILRSLYRVYTPVVSLYAIKK